MDFRLEGTRRIVNLLTFMLRSLKAERCDFGGKNRSGAGTLKIAQKTAFEAKGRLYPTGKVIQRLFIIDLYT